MPAAINNIPPRTILIATNTFNRLSCIIDTRYVSPSIFLSMRLSIKTTTPKHNNANSTIEIILKLITIGLNNENNSSKNGVKYCISTKITAYLVAPIRNFLGRRAVQGYNSMKTILIISQLKAKSWDVLPNLRMRLPTEVPIDGFIQPCS